MKKLPLAFFLLPVLNLANAEAPSLPEGLGTTQVTETTEAPGTETATNALEWDLRGFSEVRTGVWNRSNPVKPELPIAEARLQLDASLYRGDLSGQVTLDLVADPLPDSQRVDLRKGTGPVDLRELWGSMPLGGWGNLKAGRQVSTWGTGDFLFINDLFPKDWRAFFLGRDDEYLKAPADGIRLNAYSELANLDLVLNPAFMPDRYISGERLSYYEAGRGAIVGAEGVIDPDIPGKPELSVRVYRIIGDIEAAAYFYHGYWKSPAGQNASGRPVFPELRVFGASLRKPVMGGIGNIEFGYYDSRDDADGGNPAVRNSEFRALVGFERELARELTGSLQWYMERMDAYGAYLDSLPRGFPRTDRTRHVLTLRLTKRLMMQDLQLSLFAFYSPSDKDGYLRPSVRYKIDDQWEVTAGGNLFLGEAQTTFFGQFEKNSNLYLSLRLSF